MAVVRTKIVMEVMRIKIDGEGGGDVWMIVMRIKIDGEDGGGEDDSDVED